MVQNNLSIEMQANIHTESIKKIVVVLGMHRSGTSVLSRGLQALGVSIGDNLLDFNEWNPKGYFEHADIVRLNDFLLGLAGKRWDSLALPPSELMEPIFEPYKKEALALLERDFAEAAICGIKDPRASRLLPFWQSVFGLAGMQDCYVIVLRNPISVALSLAARNGFRPEKSYLLWLSHLFASIKSTKDKTRVVVDYDELIDNPTAQLARVAAALEIPVCEETRGKIAEYIDSFLSGSLRHSAHDPMTVRDDPRISELVGKAYDLLRQLARDEVQTSEGRLVFEREWHALEQVLHEIAPIIRYLDDCEDQINVLAHNPETSLPAPMEPRADMPTQSEIIPVIETSLQTESTNFRVSVVIPLYNHEQFIGAAIESVLAQTARPSEIIVIDDGSTDGSAEKVRQLCKKHSEIIFWSWPNQGAHHTLNAAIHRATGDFVAILNSDDCYEPDRLAACLAIVQTNPAVEVVTTGVSFIGDNGQRVEKSFENAWYEDACMFFKKEGDLSLALFHANFLLTTSNLFIRRTQFEAVGYFSQLRYTHDLEFFLRLILAKTHIHFLDRTLLKYRCHGGNTISESKARVDVELATIFAFFLYRQRLEKGTDSVWHSWLERYVQVLGQKKLLETVEYFLALLEAKQMQGHVAAAEPLAAEFRELMAQLGVNWVSKKIEVSLLAQFVAARNVFLRRWEPTSVAQQALEIQRMNEVVVAKDEAITQQAQEIGRLNEVIVAKDAAVAEQAQEIQRLNEVIVAKDAAVAEQAQEIQRLNEVVVAKNAAVAQQAQEIQSLNEAILRIHQSKWYRLGKSLKIEADG